jgi:hypothetical protein
MTRRKTRLLPRLPRDVRSEPVGTFAGTIGPDAPVGTYGGAMLRRSQGPGTFAGDADAQRQGSFADTSHVVVFTGPEIRADTEVRPDRLVDAA